MDTALKTEKTDRLERVWQGTAIRELSEELVIPDALPDAAAVLEAEGVITVQGKDTEEGAVLVSAALTVHVLYAPEETGAPEALELTLPAELRLDAPGADMDCRTVIRLRLRSLEARLLNSRKAAVRAELEAEAACYRPGVLALAVGMASEEAEAAVHLRREEAAVMPVSDVREKTFVVTDEYVLPAGMGDGARLLSRRAEALVEDAQLVSGKVVFRGRVRSELLFGGGETPVLGRYETEFSQIMEIDGEGEALPEMTLFFTGVYFDLPEPGPEPGRLRAELHLAAQCVCREERRIEYLADVYSNRVSLLPRREETECIRRARPVTARQTVADRIEGAPREGTLVRAAARVGGVTVEDNTARAAVQVRLLYALPEGGWSAVHGRLPAEFTLSELLPGETLRGASVTVTDVYCVPSTGEARVSLRFDAMAEETCRIESVCAIAEEEAEDCGRQRAPSAVLVRLPAGTDLWSLAKRYRSSVEDILEANEGRREGLLLIPKGR